MRMVLGLALGLVVAGAAEAARLDKEACDALKAEQASLVNAGVRDNMAKGPEWAKANLSRDKISGIQKLIEVEEQIAFRCERPRPAVAAAPAVTEGEEPATAEKAAKAPKAASAAAATAAEPADPAAEPKPKSKKARKPRPDDGDAAAVQPAQPATESARPDPAATPAVKKKAARKAADDAYVPPPKPAAEAGAAEATPAKVQR